MVIAIVFCGFCLSLSACDDFSFYDLLNPDNSNGTDGVLEIIPDSVTIGLNQQTTFSAEGGTPPYTFIIVTGGGSIDETTGVFTAPDTAGTAIVRVIDFDGTESDGIVQFN